MADKKERYEILFERMDQKMDLVLEGYKEIGNKFDEAKKERELIKDHLTDEIEFVTRGLNQRIDDTREELKETREELSQRIDDTREELGEKIDKVGEKFTDHEVRIERLEEKAAV
jgi:hypothetical protein